MGFASYTAVCHKSVMGKRGQHGLTFPLQLERIKEAGTVAVRSTPYRSDFFFGLNHHVLNLIVSPQRFGFCKI